MNREEANIVLADADLLVTKVEVEAAITRMAAEITGHSKKWTRY